MKRSSTDLASALDERIHDELAPMPLLPITSEATLVACKNLLVSPNDIFVCSYPKSGTTWTQNLVCRLLAKYLGQELDNSWHLSDSAPFYEVDAYWSREDSTDDDQTCSRSKRIPEHVPLRQGTCHFRVWNTHLRPNQLPPNAKCIYVMRHPLDVLASFYHHLSNMTVKDGGYEGTPKQFGRDFLSGDILYGKWQDHIEAWHAHSVSGGSRENILWLHYDDMKEDLRGQITKLARFLVGDGGSDSTTQELLNDMVEEAVQHGSFESMKKERWRYTPKSVSWKTDATTGRPYANFVREGRIGDGQAFFDGYFQDDMKTQWDSDKALARVRWKRAGVPAAVLEKYLS